MAVPSSNALRATRLGAGGTACAVAMGPISGNPQIDNPCGSPNLVACHSQTTFFQSKSSIFLGQNFVVIGGSPGTKLSEDIFPSYPPPGYFLRFHRVPGRSKGSQGAIPQQPHHAEDAPRPSRGSLCLSTVADASRLNSSPKNATKMADKV